MSDNEQMGNGYEYRQTQHPVYIKGARKAFQSKATMFNLLRQRVGVEEPQGVVNKAFVATGPMGTGLAFTSGARLGGQTIPIGGEEITLSPEGAVIEFGVCAYSVGFTDDWLSMLAAKKDMGQYIDYRARREDEAAEEGAWQMELNIWGDGSGRHAVVSSVSGNVITVKHSDGTLANSGQVGTEHIRYANRPYIVVEPTTGTIRTLNGTAGTKVTKVTKGDPWQVTLSRMPTGTAAGDWLIPGHDSNNNYNRVPYGLPAWIDDGRTQASVYGLRRSVNDFLNATIESFQTQAGDLGRPSPALIGQGWQKANRLNPAAGGEVIAAMHPFLYSEFANGNSLNTEDDQSRTTPGPNALRRYMDDGPRMFGNTGELSIGISGEMDGLGKITYLPGIWPAITNRMDVFTPKGFRFWEVSPGWMEIEGGAGEKGAIREAHQSSLTHDRAYVWNFTDDMPNQGRYAAIDLAHNPGN